MLSLLSDGISGLAGSSSMPLTTDTLAWKRDQRPTTDTTREEARASGERPFRPSVLLGRGEIEIKGKGKMNTYFLEKKNV